MTPETKQRRIKKNKRIGGEMNRGRICAGVRALDGRRVGASRRVEACLHIGKEMGKGEGGAGS